ncbi:hypothetical protein CEXT_69161 [Caerostris extrusa]|uniref:Uncharacterized protein n=1 Tax=Caerostris extrusa TaxID=172846 RepID=A0AAV4TS81_CAEEX|nr:hypothetical protein CEXT_69111 [Caerostris extrusa]GIY48672.1 hypothetical protein CEXT_69131 [Caerostris extrusa]GIY48674.1 hypothetical protein CEXT_69141 [Caerostris extrusa]GIY48676.1 hypothetical protein CEXT_69151 [Caerostris extrusa]GIY48678.1 hypothetical protein CEXT_69161 [Caerostris extrusa]
MYAIQDLGRYSLSTILFEKKQAIFTKYFVEAIYAFNCFPAPNVDAIATFMKTMRKFALPGDTNSEKRKQIYKCIRTYTLP